jgi:hypothetical protein
LCAIVVTRPDDLAAKELLFDAFFRSEQTSAATTLIAAPDEPNARAPPLYWTSILDLARPSCDPATFEKLRTASRRAIRSRYRGRKPALPHNIDYSRSQHGRSAIVRLGVSSFYSASSSVPPEDVLIGL